MGSALCQAGRVPGAELLLWMPWALLCSAAVAVVGVRAYRRGDRAGAVGWAGWALVPPALLLTGTLRLVGRVTGAVLDWSAALVFTPTTWVGIGLGGLAAVLVGGGRALRARRGPGKPVAKGATAPAVRSGRVDAGGSADSSDDLADVEEILRRHGIS